MRNSKPSAPLTLDPLLAGRILLKLDPASAAVFADVLRLAFNPNQPRDDQGRWRKDGTSAARSAARHAKRTRSKDTSIAEAPAKPVASEEAKELFHLLRNDGKIRDYLEKVAKASRTVERGGFILIRTKGDGPKYKIVEEVPRTPSPNSIKLDALVPKKGDKWDVASLPKCAPFGSVDGAKVAEGGTPDPDYRVGFWWHTHIAGWATDSKGLPVTGEPIPSGKDLEDAGVVGMMVKFDDVTKQLRYFIIERMGKFYAFDAKQLRGTPQRASH
jgi:hypothetical protein